MKVVLATGNPGKAAELERLLNGTGIEVVTQGSLGVEAAPETACTFVENALAKARHAAAATGLPAVADDSGLAVDALGGAPGVYSARYAGEDAGDEANNRRLLEEMARLPADAPRTATFHCLMVFVRHPEDPVPVIRHGAWTGRIVDTPRGENGFGYDPLFEDPESSRTGGELSAEEKDRRSHRGIAMRGLVEDLRRELELRER